MAKRFITFCWDCGKNTVHNFIQKEETGASRLIMGLISFGFSETMNGNIGECTKCGRINKGT